MVGKFQAGSTTIAAHTHIIQQVSAVVRKRGRGDVGHAYSLHLNFTVPALLKYATASSGQVPLMYALVNFLIVLAFKCRQRQQ